MKWNKVSEIIPSKIHHGRELLAIIDHNCGYIVVRWDNNIFRFIPLSYCNKEITEILITGISHWAEINSCSTASI